MLKKVRSEPSAAINLYEDLSFEEVTDELNYLKTVSKDSSLSFARCWLKAESVGRIVSISKKSNNSSFVDDEPSETRKEISLSAGNFLLLFTRLLAAV